MPQTQCAWALLPLAAALTLAGTAEQGANDAWDPRFFLSGVNGEVRAIAIDGNNSYVGGNFVSADNLSVTNIARWNGTNWSALGGGLNGPVNAIVVRSNEIFAGGAFTIAGGTSASRIAKWDGATWSPLGSGINTGAVRALAVDASGMLYAGGNFTAAGGTSAMNLARWDGTAWTALADGVTDFDIAYVSALVIKGHELFAGGFFTNAGGMAVSSIAVWDGLAWFDVGGGVDDLDYPPQVSALAIFGNDLYAGGAFSSAGSVTAKNIAKWNGTAWSALGTGLGRYFGDLPVTAMVISGTRLIVGGRFVSAGGSNANNLAVWDGASWSEFGGGVSGKINALAATGTNIVLGGSFTLTNDASVRALAVRSEVQWRASSSDNGWGVSGEKVATLARTATNVFLAGTFNSVGSVTASNVAAWDGQNWTALGSGLNGPCFALALSPWGLVAGGQFTAAGGMSVSNIALWDGLAWKRLSGGASPYLGLNGPVRALISNGTDIFSGGSFTMAGGVPAGNIARWDGATWSGLGSSLNGPVYALATAESNLFVGGRFTVAGGVVASNLARWNGSQWFALGGGVGGNANPIIRIRPPPISALAVSGNNLFVGGDFAWAGAVSATNIARWDGTNWSALGSGLIGTSAFAPPPTVAALVYDPEGSLYAGGSFSKTGTLDLPAIGMWDGERWQWLGDGISASGAIPLVQVLLLAGAQLYVGGDFQFAGSKPASNCTIWHLPQRLQIARDADAVFLSGVWALGARLQSARALSSSSWQGITNSLQTTRDRLSATLPASSNNAFFRLKQY